MLTTSGLTHPYLLIKGLVQLCYPGEKQGQLYQVLGLVGNPNNSPMLVSSGQISHLPPLPPALGIDQQGRGEEWELSSNYVASRQMRNGYSTAMFATLKLDYTHFCL